MVKKVGERNAKQGTRGRRVLIILIAGIALIVVGYLIIGGIGVSTSPDDGVEEMTNENNPDQQINQDTPGEVVEPQ